MNIPGRRYFAGDDVYSDWFPRGGDSCLIRVQKVQTSIGGDADVTVALYTKNSEDTGDGTEVEISSSPARLVVDVSATGDNTVLTLQVNSSTTEGLEEMLRIRVTVDGTAGEWTTVRILPPIFFDIAS